MTMISESKLLMLSMDVMVETYSMTFILIAQMYNSKSLI